MARDATAKARDASLTLTLTLALTLTLTRTRTRTRTRNRALPAKVTALDAQLDEERAERGTLQEAVKAAMEAAGL